MLTQLDKGTAHCCHAIVHNGPSTLY